MKIININIYHDDIKRVVKTNNIQLVSEVVEQQVEEQQLTIEQLTDRLDNSINEAIENTEMLKDAMLTELKKQDRNKKETQPKGCVSWWGKVDSNHRSQ